jgi:hypothetical protein
MTSRPNLIRIVSTEWTLRQVEDLARREGRTLSAMGQRLVTEALEARKSAVTNATKDVDRLVAALKGFEPAPVST